MLLIDGVKYELWIPKDEEREFQPIVKEHYRDIFGERSEYFEKRKLESKLGIGSIPDGFVIIFGDSPCWHIVEVELSEHDLHKHIVSQVSKFVIGIRNPQTQKKLTDAICEEINKDDFLKLRVKKAVEPGADIHWFISEVISKPPVLTVIIEKRAEGLAEALSAFAHQIKVVEFQTFVRGGPRLDVHAHLFEPLYKPVPPPPPPPPILLPTSAFEITLQPAYIKSPYIYFSAARKDLFPNSNTTLELETDIGVIEVGFYPPPWGPGVQKGLTKWFKAHPELKAGDKLVIEVIEPMKKYRLRKA